jgi:hypothetical protein
MSKTKKTTDWLGREKEEHFNDEGKKIGETRFTTNWLGTPVQEHFDVGNEKTGETRAGRDWLGHDRAEHFNTKHERIGTSRNETDWLSHQVQRHYGRSGDRVGETRAATDWFGRPYKEHQGEYFKAGDGASNAAAPSDGGYASGASSIGTPVNTGRTLHIFAVSAFVVLIFAAGSLRTTYTNRESAQATVNRGSSRNLPSRASLRDAKKVPLAIRSLLDKEYPGWFLPEVTAEDRRICRQPNANIAPGFVWGDFDGDGARDYAISIQQKDKRYTLIFLARGSKFAQYAVMPSGWNILGVQRKGVMLPRLSPEEVGGDSTGYLEGQGSVTLNADALIGIHCESSAVAYVYMNGDFRHFYISD